MALRPGQLTTAHLEFLRERHLGTIATVGPDGRPHVVPVGFTFDPIDGIVRIITQAHSVKARHLAGGGPVAVTQVDGRRWLSLRGTGSVSTDPERIARAVAAYAARYHAPRSERAATRVAIEVVIDQVLGRP
jgi:PPOX class probable F420-dependent enzyme